MDVDYRQFLALFQAEAQDNLATIEESLLGLEANPGDGELLNSLFRAAHTLKGNSGSLGLRPIAELAHALEDLLERFRARSLPVTRPRVDVLLESVDTLRLLLAAADGPSEAEAPPLLLARLQAVTQGDQPNLQPSFTPEAQAASRSPAEGETQTQRVDVAKLDRLLDLATEIAIDRSRLGLTLGAAGTAVLDPSEHLYAELHDLVMRARLVPLRPMLSHFGRVTRDLAATTGKPARLVIEERGVEVDLRIAEGLRDPLTHMIRNAFDHGVETPEVRRASGKDARATITLRARHDAFGLLIQMSDDGVGLDRARILERAMARGMVRDARGLDDKAVYELIFAPGFSTAATVTELSGRGVGLDVVRRHIEGLRGTVEIGSEPGKGTTLTLHLPLTLAFVDALAVEVAGQTYLIPMEGIEECVDLPEGAVPEGSAMMERKGRSLALLPLGPLFGQPTPSRQPRVVVARHAGGHLGLVVDALQGGRKAVIKPLSARARGLGVFAGSTILGDGQVALLLDVAALVERATASSAAMTAQAQKN
jgi:two-component system chemotaxis sensor kinase CheA